MREIDLKYNSDLSSEGDTDIRLGSLQVRLAQSEEEIIAAQKLRYSVFYDEMAAKPDAVMAEKKLDFDEYDDVADHLLVLDHRLGEGAKAVIGTYRMMRRKQAAKVGQFYTSSEYDINPLIGQEGDILELGRSCVHANYRTRPTLQLMWRGIANYLLQHDITLMFGCGSLHGTDPHQLAEELSYLYHYHLAPPALRPRALDGLYTDMRLIPSSDINKRRVLSKLPPLIKGYLRVGAFIGDGAFIDHQFNTTDVCIVVKTDLITEKYAKHYLAKD